MVGLIWFVVCKVWCVYEHVLGCLYDMWFCISVVICVLVYVGVFVRMFVWLCAVCLSILV